MKLFPFVVIKTYSIFPYSEATETRHALHGVRWPASNPKTLHVDFGRETDMEKAIMSSLDETVTRTITNDVATRGGDPEANNSFGWSKADAYRTEAEEKAKVSKKTNWINFEVLANADHCSNRQLFVQFVNGIWESNVQRTRNVIVVVKRIENVIGIVVGTRTVIDQKSVGDEHPKIGDQEVYQQVRGTQHLCRMFLLQWIFISF